MTAQFTEILQLRAVPIGRKGITLKSYTTANGILLTMLTIYRDAREGSRSGSAWQRMGLAPTQMP